MGILGQRLVITAEEKDGKLYGSKALVRPEKLSIHHYTAIVEDKTEATVQLGVIRQDGNPSTLTVATSDATDLKIGEIFTSVVKDRSNSQQPELIPEMKNFKPF